jgi:hypothetical protein
MSSKAPISSRTHIAQTHKVGSPVTHARPHVTYRNQHQQTHHQNEHPGRDTQLFCCFLCFVERGCVKHVLRCTTPIYMWCDIAQLPITDHGEPLRTPLFKSLRTLPPKPRDSYTETRVHQVRCALSRKQVQVRNLLGLLGKTCEENY